MGEYAGQAKEYAEQVGEVMGIDPGEFMRNQASSTPLSPVSVLQATKRM